MKKFTEWVGAIRQADLNEVSELQKSYQDYFERKLEKFGVQSPAELNEEDKKKFFVEITNEWEKGKVLKDGVAEAIVFEADIKTDDDFREYVNTILKKQHPDDFDEAKAKEVADGLLSKKKGDDYGTLIGMLNKS